MANDCTKMKRLLFTIDYCILCSIIIIILVLHDSMAESLLNKADNDGTKLIAQAVKFINGKRPVAEAGLPIVFEKQYCEAVKTVNAATFRCLNVTQYAFFG